MSEEQLVFGPVGAAGAKITTPYAWNVECRAARRPRQGLAPQNGEINGDSCLNVFTELAEKPMERMRLGERLRSVGETVGDAR